MVRDTAVTQAASVSKDGILSEDVMVLLAFFALFAVIVYGFYRFVVFVEWIFEMIVSVIHQVFFQEEQKSSIPKKRNRRRSPKPEAVQQKTEKADEKQNEQEARKQAIKQRSLDQRGSPVNPALVGNAGYAARNHTYRKMKNFPIPKDKRDVQVYTGLVAWMQQMVPNFAEHAVPLTDLLKANRPFKWTPECQAAFDQLKKDVFDSRPLEEFDENAPLNIHVRATDVSVSSAVLQLGKDHEWRPIEYNGQKLQMYEKDWDETTKNLYAILIATRKHRKLLGNKRFVVSTTNRIMSSLVEYRHDRAKEVRDLNELFPQWLMELRPLDFDVEVVDKVHLDK
ncbi:hypothetical protein DIURU_003164 [Diutina rugosa]|uniref:Reverse transcriptase/retrotransposon-derived protein RNase H-like domain-containing protein n=1 Tax=Diutina rugosa TaxID=5481 RepID=A0A642UMC2_DIURU|nr:uncharacterized protein DIURU_003164 [Diutina rugosa]KAA8901636.1 hypothetical protein DIURU_003164 [Diutina rugosa]